MKKFSLIITFCWIATSLMAQKATSAAAEETPAPVQVEINCELDANHVHNTVVQQPDGYYLYLYDSNCKMAMMYDEKYILKYYLGANYDEALESLFELKNWYKSSRRHAQERRQPKPGQDFMIYKYPAYGVLVTTGGLSDIEWYKDNSNSYGAQIVFLGMAAHAEKKIAEKVEARMAAKQFHLTSGFEMEDFKRTIRQFQKSHN